MTRWIGLAVLMVAVALAGCRKKPAAKIDLSNPKAAALTFTRAIESGDVETAQAAAYAAGIEHDLVEAMALAIPSLKRLDAAARAKYGAEGGDLVEHSDILNSVPAIESAEVAADENRARLTNSTGQIISQLKNVDGMWKVDVGASILGDDVTRQIEPLRALGNIADQLAGDIEAGKFATVADAKRELHLRLLIEQRGRPLTTTTAPAETTPPTTAPGAG